ncbi:MAG: hypothetical protein ACK5LL_17255 [Suipraeoptans sp.]
MDNILMLLIESLIINGFGMFLVHLKIGTKAFPKALFLLITLMYVPILYMRDYSGLNPYMFELITMAAIVIFVIFYYKCEFVIALCWVVIARTITYVSISLVDVLRYYLPDTFYLNQVIAIIGATFLSAALVFALSTERKDEER